MTVLNSEETVVAYTTRVTSPSTGFSVRVPAFRKKRFEGSWGNESFPTLDVFPSTEFKDFAAAPDGGFYAVGTALGDSIEFSTDFFIVKFSSDFEILWSKKYGNHSSEFIQKIAVAPSGDLLLWGISTTQFNTTISSRTGVFFN